MMDQTHSTENCRDNKGIVARELPLSHVIYSTQNCCDEDYAGKVF